MAMKRRSSTKKSPYKKRRTRSDVIARVPRRWNIGDTQAPMRTSLRYSDAYVLQSTGALPLTTYSLQPNNLFDVDVTAAGHQPLYFDQLSAIYNNYRVRSAKARVVFSYGQFPDTAGQQLGPWKVGIVPQRVNTTLPGTGTDWLTASETRGASIDTLTTQEKVVLYQTYTWKQSGVNAIEEITYPTGGGTAPNPFYWLIYVFNQGNVATTNVLVNIDIVFDVEFLNVKTIATS